MHEVRTDLAGLRVEVGDLRGEVGEIKTEMRDRFAGVEATLAQILERLDRPA